MAADAPPACRVGTDAITAAVIGAIVSAMPMPHRICPGKITPKYDESAWVRSSRSRPSAENEGPSVMNHRDP